MAGALLMLSFDIGVRYRLLENTLLASQCFLLHLFAWSFGFDVLKKNTAEKLYVLPFSTSLSARSWLLGRFSGAAILVVGMGLLFLLVDTVLFAALKIDIFSVLMLQVLLYVASACLSLAVIFFLSCFLDVLSALIYGVVLWIIGHGLDELLLLTDQQFEPAVQILVQCFYYLLPNFSFFDISSQALNRLPIETEKLVFILTYPLIYIVVLLDIGAAIFSRKPIGQ